MEQQKILRRVQLTKNDESLAIMQLTECENEFRISFIDRVGSDIVELVENQVARMKTRKSYDDKIALWDDLLVALEGENISFNEVPTYDAQMSLVFDVESGEKLMTSRAAIPGKHVSDDIVRSISQSVNRALKDFGKDTVNEIENALKQDSREAFNLLKEGESQGLLHSSSVDTKKRLFQVVQQIEPSSLLSEERKRLFEIRFILGGQAGKYAPLYDDVCQYLKEFGDQIEPKLFHNLLLTKANAASQQGKKELAYSLYKEVLEQCLDDPSTIAWAHRGLALTLGSKNPDAMYHEGLAADAFLLSGNKDDFASSKVALANYEKFRSPERAIELLDEAISVFDINDPLQRDRVAALSLTKANIYHMCGQDEPALNEAKRSVELRDEIGQFGNESKIIASIQAVLHFQGSLRGGKKHQPLEDEYKAKIDKLEERMIDEDKPSYSLRKRLANAMTENDLSEFENMEQDIIDQDDPDLVASYWMALVLAKSDVSFSEKIEFVERAWAVSDASDDMRATICSLFAGLYMNDDDADKALEWYKKALDINPLLWESRQNYAGLLWKTGRWDEAVVFFEEQKQRFGDLPSVVYAYGKSLLESKRAREAVPVLGKAVRLNPGVGYVQECLERALAQLDGELPISTPAGNDITEETEEVTIAALERCLSDFVEFVQNDKRMTFWRLDSERKRKWATCPEQHGQNLLHTFVKSRFRHNVEAIEEVNAGAGRIDVYLRFINGVRTVIELKMCGNGYSEGYSLHGWKQLVHYLENKQTCLGYLVVFDGRMRDYGKGIESQYLHENYIIRSFVVDVRPEVVG